MTGHWPRRRLTLGVRKGVAVADWDAYGTGDGAATTRKRCSRETGELGGAETTTRRCQDL